MLASTSTDNVFLNFSDHGAPGLIAFPNEYLYATDLLAALKYMFDNKMYAKLVYYLEACESGSMFTSLPTNQNIYATTAADPNESSWGAYCGSDATVGGINIGSCLGDLYSIVWMEDSDNKVAGETLADQFQTILKLTDQSHPQQYGTLNFVKDTVAQWINGPVSKANKTAPTKHRNLVNSRDIKLHYLIDKHANEMNDNSMAELNEEIMMRKTFDSIFTEIKPLHEDKPIALDTDFDCYKNLINFFERTCGKFTEYGMKYMRSFYDICAHKTEAIVHTKQVVLKFCAVGKLF